MQKITIIGLGDVLRGDYGAACYVLEAVAEKTHSESIQFDYMGNDPRFADGLLYSADLAIVVGTMKLSGVPGGLHIWNGRVFEQHAAWMAEEDPALRHLLIALARADLTAEANSIVIINFGKSEQAGLVFGGMIVERSGVNTPIVQVECSGPFFVEWIEGCDPGIIAALHGIGLSPQAPVPIEPSVWQADGNIYRRMTTAGKGDFIFVDGIMVGRAIAEEVTFVSRDGHLVEIQGAAVKAHGIEKLDRFLRPIADTRPATNATDSIPYELIVASGLTGFYSSRKFYIYRQGAEAIDSEEIGLKYY